MIRSIFCTAKAAKAGKTPREGLWKITRNTKTRAHVNYYTKGGQIVDLRLHPRDPTVILVPHATIEHADETVVVQRAIRMNRDMVAKQPLAIDPDVYYESGLFRPDGLPYWYTSAITLASGVCVFTLLNPVSPWLALGTGIALPIAAACTVDGEMRDDAWRRYIDSYAEF